MKKFYLLMMFALLGMVANAQTFQKVTDVAQLAAGDKVVFVNEEAQKIMAEQKTNNRGAADVQISGDQIIEIPEGATVFTVGKGVTNVDCFTFFDSVENGYLYAASSSKNYLKIQDNLDENGEWKIEISTETTVKAQGKNSRNSMRYNPNNGSPLFACYSSGQKPITLYKEAGEVDPNQVVAPTFSLTSGTYEGTQSLTMDCATEGATIYYTVNGGDTQTYTDAIELAEGEYAFVAWAEKDGMTKSSEMTANYTIVAPLVANSIAEFLTLGAAHTDREITLNCDLTVTYQGGGNDNTRDLYVKDAAGKGLLIFGVNSVYSNGNIIPAGLKGKLKDYNGLPELVNPSNFGEVISGEEVSPEAFTAATITADDLSKYIVLNEVTLTELNNKNGTLTDASGDVVIRDNGYCEYPTDFSKEYDVTAVVATFNGTIQVYPVEIVEHTSSSVNDAVANEFKAVAVANGIEVNVAEAGLVSVYNAAGQLVANVNVAEGATTINVAGGFYIVKAGNNVAKVLVK